MQLPIAGGAYQDMSIDINNQRCVNWFPAFSGPYGRGNAGADGQTKILLPTQGCKEVINLPGLSVRNMVTVRDYVYIVVDENVYKTKVNEITKTATWENIGQISTSTGIVQSAFNPTQIMWVDGDGYVYTDDPLIPTITTLTPATVNVNGGALMTITGTNFTPESVVRLGGIPQGPITYVNTTTLTFTCPTFTEAYAAVLDLEVNNGYTSAYVTNAFAWTQGAPTVTNYAPISGSISGYTYLRLVGTEFGPNTLVFIDGRPAASVVGLSPTSLLCWTPLGTSIGPKTIRVQTAETSNILTNAFAYNNTAPFCSFISPTTGSVNGGTEITIFGGGFTTAYSAVYVGDQLCSNYTFVSSAAIRATVPPYVGGSLVKDVRAEQPNAGVLNTGLVAAFTYIEEAPTYLSMTETKGLIEGGQDFIIIGGNFNINTTVTIGGVLCPSIRVLSTSQIRVLSPPSPTGEIGTFPVVITNNAGSVSGWDFTYTTGIFQQLSAVDPDYPENTFQVAYIGGYFVVACRDTQQMYASAINNGLSWNAADTANAENSPDRIVALGVAKGELWVFGEYSTEIWYQTANPTGFPLSPRSSLAMQIGCAATQSVASVNDLLVWVDNRGFIVQSNVSPYLRDTSSGYDLEIISTDALNQELLSYSTLDDAIGMSYNDRGHIMYQITFVNEQKTWVFDYEVKEWHERLYYSEFAQNLEHHLGQFCCRYKNISLIGGVRSGRIYAQSPEYVDDAGRDIQRIRTTPFLYIKDDLKFITINAVKLRIGQIQAFPITEDDDIPVQIGLRHSRDGGHSWSNRIFRVLGQRGKYAQAVVWNRVGNSREWVLEFLISGKVSCSIVDAWLVSEAEQ